MQINIDIMNKEKELMLEEICQLEFKKAEYLNKILVAIEGLVFKPKTKKEEENAKSSDS